MGRRGPGKGRRSGLRPRSGRWQRRLPALLSRLRRRWRSFWHWEVLRALRDFYPALRRARAPGPGELRQFPQRNWH
ncbi:MAG: hypothetical protein AB2385_13545 [Symbiobacterium sp.]|mgnify:CR=1 FL=1|uniref:hypothetical protein n=1 Tax=Symbiobacterium sp. TaxID=1971213 RepID=UPI00346435E5